MDQWTLDINVDLGECPTSDAKYIDDQLMPLITSCNIATGFHAGDPEQINHTLDLAKQHGVLVGAHIAYPDRFNFGRVSLDYAIEHLIEMCLSQIRDFKAACISRGMVMHHIKPHGALYHDLCWNQEIAAAFVKAIHMFDQETIIYGLPYCPLAKEAKKYSILYWPELFADRAYHDDGHLVSRKLDNSVLSSPKEITSRLLVWLQKNKMETYNGSLVHVEAKTICVHSDSPNALEILTALVKLKKEYGRS